MKMFTDPNYPIECIIEDIANLALLLKDPQYKEKAQQAYIVSLQTLASTHSKPEVRKWAEDTLKRYTKHDKC